MPKDATSLRQCAAGHSRGTPILPPETVRDAILSVVSTPNQVEKSSLKIGICLEYTEKPGRHGGGIGLAHPPHRHALVQCIDHDGDTFGGKRVIDSLSDLRRHGFLGLQPVSINIDHAGQFGKADNPPCCVKGRSKLLQPRLM